MPEQEHTRITYQYPGDGNTKLFPIHWPYIDRGFVVVKLQKDPRDEDYELLIPDSDYNWITDSQIEITPAPPSGSSVIITRNTPSDRALTKFRDGAVLLGKDLNGVSEQMLHIIEEGRDYTDQVHDYVGKAEGYLEKLAGLDEAVDRAEAAAERADKVLNLSIAVDDAPYGHVTSGSYNVDTGMLTFLIPEGKTGPDGAPGQDGRDGHDGQDGKDGQDGQQGKPGPEGPQGQPGPMGESPLPMAFGQFHITPAGMLRLSYSGSLEPEAYFINPETGHLEVAYADN